jgi:hypothetical protein
MRAADRAAPVAWGSSAPDMRAAARSQRSSGALRTPPRSVLPSAQGRIIRPNVAGAAPVHKPCKGLGGGRPIGATESTRD